MISLTELDAEAFGKWVQYTPFKGAIPEIGRIKSWNSEYIFVVYTCDKSWSRFQDFTAAATKPEDLEYCCIQTHN